MAFITIDWTIKMLTMLSSLYHVVDFTMQERTNKNVMFVRNLWLPQLIVSTILFITSTISSLSITRPSAPFLFGDVFVLTTVEKLLAIGFNTHLIFFFATLEDIDIAFMVLPITVFTFCIFDALVAVAYLEMLSLIRKMPRGRRSANDVVCALKRQGRTLYGFGG